MILRNILWYNLNVLYSRIQVLKLIEETNKKYNVTTIIITHNEAITPMSDRVIKFKSGKVVNVEKNKKRKSIDELEW